MIAGAAIAPATADAGCGGVRTGQPQRHVVPGRAPLAIGDSTMLLALPDLTRRGFAVNAHGCRQFPEALALLRSLVHAHQLPRLVVIALGADGTVGRGDVAAALRVLGRDRVLVLVTPRELGGGSGSDATTVRNAGRSHPAQVEVLDWVAHSAGQGAWFQPDGVHLTFPGAIAFARLLATTLPLAVPRPRPLVLAAGGDRVRIPPNRRWHVLRAPGPRTAVVRAPGRCGYRVVLRAASVPAATDPAAPAGALSVRSGRADDGRTWRTWREPGTSAIGGAWAAPLAGGGSLVVQAQGVAAAGCSVGLARPARGALFAALERARLV